MIEDYLVPTILPILGDTMSGKNIRFKIIYFKGRKTDETKQRSNILDYHMTMCHGEKKIEGNSGALRVALQ